MLSFDNTMLSNDNILENWLYLGGFLSYIYYFYTIDSSNVDEPIYPTLKMIKDILTEISSFESWSFVMLIFRHFSSFFVFSRYDEGTIAADTTF